MFKLRDFIHLAQLDHLLDQLIRDDSGLVIVAGPDPRPLPGPTSFSTRQGIIPSGRSAIFNILIQEILTSYPGARAIVIGQDKSRARGPRQLKHRMEFLPVEESRTYLDQIEIAVRKKPHLLVIDQLDRDNVYAVLEAVQKGLRVVAQMDTILWGAEFVRQLSEWGIPDDLLSGLSWVFTVQRIAALCAHCKQPSPPDKSVLNKLFTLHPHLSQSFQDMVTSPEIGKPVTFYQAKGCSQCHQSGRHGDIAIFDLFHNEKAAYPLFEQSSLLSMEEYMLRMTAMGHLALEDILRLETNHLRHAYNLLTTSDQALSETSAALNRRLAELEAANRVLLQRTEVLISLQDIGEALISSDDLSDLAGKVCRMAGNLCGADRAILYLLRSFENSAQEAEIVAVSGWDSAILHRQLDAAQVFGPTGSGPGTFSQWPPGVPPVSDDSDKRVVLQAGLRLPLLTQDRQVGLMLVHSTQKPRFLPGEVALLRTFANQAALAIQRAGLIEELRSKIDQLESAQMELVKKERMERELELARQVQQSMLPHTFPQVPGFTFAARNEPARQVGGDFYDVIALEGDRFGLVIADVSDKGMPAALYMALSRSLLLAEARRSPSPVMVLTNVNRILLELGDAGAFVSVFYGVVDTIQQKLTYTRAGHERPLLIRQGEILRLGGDGAVLGVLDESELKLSEEQIDLKQGDRLVMYTDGMADVLDSEGQFYSLQRLEELLKSHARLPLAEMCATTFSDLITYKGKAGQFDDMTLLAMQVG